VQFTVPVESYGAGSQSDQQAPAFGQQAVAERVAATGGADCVVSGCACCSDSCGFDISNANRRGGSLDAEAFSSEGRRSRQGKSIKQDWDPSVKSARASFPSVLENMDKNLSWSSALGEAYANDPQDVTDAVQQMRQGRSEGWAPE